MRTTTNRMFKFSALALIAASFVLAPGQAVAKTYRVEGKSFRELLMYDADATRVCARGKLPPYQMSRVVFVADGNAAFSWSPQNPEYYFQGIGWSNCKAYRKKPQASAK